MSRKPFEEKIKECIIVGDYAVSSDMYQFIVYDILEIQDGDNKGRNRLSNPSYHATMDRIVEELLQRGEKDNIPDIDRILKSHRDVVERLSILIKIEKK